MHERTSEEIQVSQGDCLDVLREMGRGSVHLIYLDPPFLTQKTQRLTTRDRMCEFSFDDLWSSHSEYAAFLLARLREMYRVLSPRGSLFFHCDRRATHIARGLLEEVFGAEHLRAEIIWHYRRWSNSQRQLLPAHQTIYYFSKSADYTFNTMWDDYSPSTNVDQILQARARDSHGKSVYKRDSDGNIVTSGMKRGVPLCDVWDIPYLNPKAKERVGYPTQKPLLLLERILEIASVEGDCVLDPFCGSGTTLVAAQLMHRKAIGIDVSNEAVELTRQRLGNPIKSDSRVLRVGRESYRQIEEVAVSHLRGLDYVPVHRNKGIDGILKLNGLDSPVPVRVQRPGESLGEAGARLHSAGKTKNARVMFLIATSRSNEALFAEQVPADVVVIKSVRLNIEEHLDSIMSQHGDAGSAQPDTARPLSHR